VETNHNFLTAGGQPVSDRMRELLARAAQDHVYEQRSQGQILDEIRQRLEGMEWLLREVRERELTGLTGQLETVRGQVDELVGKPPEWAEGLAEHIEAVGERVKPVAELPALWADVGVIAENVDEGLSRLQTVIESAQHISDATHQAAQRMDDMTVRLDKLQGSMEAASVRFNRLDKSLAELGHRAERLEHSVNNVTSRVDQSLNDMAERVEQGLQAVSGRLEGVGGRLDGLEGRMDGLDGRLEGVSTRIEGIDGRVDSVGARISRLPGSLEIDELRQRVTELLDQSPIDHSDRFDALEKRFIDGVEPLADGLRTRPDRQEVEEIISKILASVYDAMAKRSEAVQDDVGKKVADIHEDVGKRMTAIHEDVLKRLATLEETVLALAEALLRPRREGKDIG
jgi:archaellum component FlaC